MVFSRLDKNTPRPNLIVMSPDIITAMQTAHDGFIEDTRNIKLPFTAGTRGIVSTAGGDYVPIFIISLRMLRRTGCDLPVELLIQTKDEEPYLCDTLLPSLNAKCIFLPDYLGPKAETIAHFQLKIFSILFSSFESVLFLDADSFAVTDPTPLFQNEPFQTAGLITWPDFWASSASPSLYAIQSLPVPPMTLRPSSESGQLLVSKSAHTHTLLLSTYYNYHGPTHYFPLMSQGAPGQGDKETFLSAAETLHAPFYQTKSRVDTIGYEGPDHYHGVAMLQYDPMADDAAGTASSNNDKKRPFAIHHNYPKLDPVKLFLADDVIAGGEAVVGDVDKGVYHRLLGDKDVTVQRFGRDVEAEMWVEVEVVACQLGNVFEGWHVLPASEGQKGTCEMVKEFRTVIFA